MNYLIVVDMQRDFVNGSLGSQMAEGIVENVCGLIERYKTLGGTIFCTLDTHDENYLSTAEGKSLPVKHCIKGTDGWQLDERVSSAVGTRAQLVEKPTFGSLKLAGLLSECVRQGDSIELCGLCTDICVVSNALLIKAFLPETEIIVRESCCAGVTPESHKAALDTMKACQIKVID